MLWQEEKKSWKSLFISFLCIILQKFKDKHIKTTKDIQRLIHRRMEMWQEEKYDLLINEAEICDKKLPRSCSNMSEEQAIKKNRGLCWRGKYAKQLDS